MSLTAALPRPVNVDRFGVIASTLCAIHCAVTPILLILLSIVTTLGGLALILTHIGNLCCCRSCRRDKPEM